MKSKIEKKNFANLIFKCLLKNKEVKSVTITGSFFEKKIDAISDIDTVVIVNKLNKKIYRECISSIKELQIRKFTKKDYTIKINSTFGPLKLKNNDKTIVIHLMIYDIQGHIDHCTKSPFTCFDWQRSMNFSGIKMNEICEVKKLQLSDFVDTRRGIKNYIKDLKMNKITYREYVFKDKKYYQKKNLLTLTKFQKIEFYYHIIKFLIINYFKFENNVNKLPNEKEFKQTFNKIIKSKTLYNYYKILKNYKDNGIENKLLFNNKKIDLFVNTFLSFINKKNTNTNLIFLRHQRTPLNDGTFLGQRRDPGISKNLKFKIKTKNFAYIYSSPLRRAYETAIKISKNIIIDKNLNEIDYGLYEGKNIKDIKKINSSFLMKWSKGIDMKFPKGENTKDIFLRTKKFTKKISKIISSEKINKPIIIVTHNVYLRCLIGNAYDINMRYWHLINIEHVKEFKFIYFEKKIIPDIDREQQINIFKRFYE
jgi:ribonuclease H / adenosylcobalamin/alpha-ribazole phosphatase